MRFLIPILVACGSTPVKPPDPPPTQHGAKVAHVTVAMTKRGGEAVALGGTLKTGDTIEIWATPDQVGYLYVVQFFSDGTYDMLYPPLGVAEQIQASQRVRVPHNPKAWLQVSGSSSGEEHVHVLFTRAPLATISPALAKGLGLAVDSKAVAPAVVLDPAHTEPIKTEPPPVPVDAGTPVVAPPPPAPSSTKITRKYTTKAGGKKPLLTTYDRGSKSLTEIVIDDQPVSISPTSGITVQTFWYVHAP